MLLNPDILRSFAGQADIASDAIHEADVGSKVSTAADGLDRLTTQWAARLVCAHVTEIAAKIAENVSKMGVAVIRHYWKHPENPAELTDGRALERLRNEQFDPE